MNGKRRSELRDALLMLSRAATIVESACDREQDALVNYPENLQSTEKYETMESAAENLTEAVDKINEAKECIEAAVK